MGWGLEWVSVREWGASVPEATVVNKDANYHCRKLGASLFKEPCRTGPLGNVLRNPRPHRTKKPQIKT